MKTYRVYADDDHVDYNNVEDVMSFMLDPFFIVIGETHKVLVETLENGVVIDSTVYDVNSAFARAYESHHN
jgi:hypothetical protein